MIIIFWIYTYDSYLYLTYRSQKENRKLLEAQEEHRLIRCQKDYLELEIRKFRRKRLNQFHLFEQGLLREVCKLFKKLYNHYI